MTKKKGKFTDPAASVSIAKRAKKSDHGVLAVWAADCAVRVLPFFEKECPDDERPRKAIADAWQWARDGIFHMAAVRGSALGAHAAAREVRSSEAARFAARAAGHAIATAHVPTHSIAAAWYAAKAVWASDPDNAEYNVGKERQWQYGHLVRLEGAQKRNKSKKG